MSGKLTKNQASALQFCRDYFARNDQLPPAKRMAEHFSWASPNAAHDVFKALEKQGHIERNDNGKYRFKTATRPDISERGIWS